jgi:hypothetical protein
MKDNFKNLKTEVSKHNDPAMNIIIDLLEEYNNRLSSYFKNREVTRSFMDAIDINFSVNVFKEKFGNEIIGNMSIQQLIIDLNTLARSTWYFEREDGLILTGQTLYENKAVYMASVKIKEPIYANKEDEEILEAFDDHTLHFPEITPFPEPIGYQEVIEDIPGEENVSNIKEMVSLVQWHAICNKEILLSPIKK